VSEFIFALGLVAVIEGLVLVLAPSRFEDLVKALESMSHEKRRMLGLVFVAIGVATVWAVKAV
jgi:uncharacterized protein YjeT (DUF2065 family)